MAEISAAFEASVNYAMMSRFVPLKKPDENLSVS
ncbi:hypothetical protein M2145_001107 [Lachnospiraceae bacterium PF1-21]